MLSMLSASKWVQKRASISRKKNFEKTLSKRGKERHYSQLVKTIRSIVFSRYFYTSSRSPTNTAIFPANDNITPHGLTPIPLVPSGHKCSRDPSRYPSLDDAYDPWLRLQKPWGTLYGHWTPLTTRKHTLLSRPRPLFHDLATHTARRL